MGALQEFNTKAVARDPAALGYPPTLPIELALRTAPIERLCEEYNLSRQEWDRLRRDPQFITDLTGAVELVKKDGMSFRLKAKLQAEELLKTSWRMIHSDSLDVPPAVRADLLKATMRWAGYEIDAKSQQGAFGGNALNIQINLGT